jgi:hypothetical protein
MTSFAETLRELATPSCCLVIISHMTALQVAVHCKQVSPVVPFCYSVSVRRRTVFVCGLFDESVGSSDCIVLNGARIDCNAKYVEGSGRGLI